MSPLPVSKEELEELDEQDLLEFIADKVNDENLAQRAMTVLYIRHYPTIFPRLKKFTRSFIQGDKPAEDLLQDTMLKIYQKAKSFRIPNEIEREKVSKLFLAWAFKIAQNIFFESRRKNQIDEKSIRLFQDQTTDEQIMSEVAKKFNSPNIDSANDKKVQDFAGKLLEELSPSKKEIVLTYIHYQYYQMNVPSSDLDELALRHHTTKENMRQIYSRTLRSFKGKFSSLEKAE